MKKPTKEKLIKQQYYLTCFKSLKLNYQKVPKSGTTSILNALLLTNIGHVAHSEVAVSYISLEEAYNNKYRTFVVTRNPIDRVRSMYKDFFFKRKRFGIGGSPECIKEMLDLRKAPNFSRFVDILSRYPDSERDLHFKSQKFYCKHDNMEYYKLENLKDNISKLSTELTFELTLHATNSNSIELTQKDIQSIKDTFKEDFVLWENSL
jgi:hypothetical protein